MITFTVFKLCALHYYSLSAFMACIFSQTYLPEKSLKKVFSIAGVTLQMLLVTNLSDEK